MFKIGEFSKIAQVPISLLRYYDKIDLFTPVNIDEQTNYRSYSAQQLPELNRILALKDLGMPLEQIKKFVQDNVSQDELHTMLLNQQAQVEQNLREETERLNAVKSRIRQMERTGDLSNLNIVVKSVPKQNYLALRKQCQSFEEARQLLTEIVSYVPQELGSSVVGNYMGVNHSEGYDMENLDVQMGVQLKEVLPSEFSLTLASGAELKATKLEALDSAVTIIRSSTQEAIHESFAEVGSWIEDNNYRLSGPYREVLLELGSSPQEVIFENQFPVEKLDNA